jgi:hypothetical protein
MAPLLGCDAIKIGDRENPSPWVKWWSWGDLNPRPQAFFAQFYMCSRLICVSPLQPRSGTLKKKPAALSLVKP